MGLALAGRALPAAALETEHTGRPAIELLIREGPSQAAPLRPATPGLGSVLNGWSPSGTLSAPRDGRANAPSSARRYERYEGPLSGLETRLFADAADGRWDAHSLLAASLVASGVSDPAALGRHQARFAELVAELRRSGRVTGPPRQQAQAVFEFMHRRMLCGGYQLDGTDLAALLDQGRFNCVSASVLFNCLAGELGLSACGLEIPGHALSRLLLPDGNLDVETTCPEWFRLLDDPRKQAELVARTLGPQRAAGRAEDRRQVSDVELVATIYYNRGVDLLGQKRFADAVAANAKALRLDPHSQTARGNLLATLNNWAIAEAAPGRYDQAAELLRQGMAIDPGYETFKANYRHVHREWTDRLCRMDQFSAALAVLVRAAQECPGDPTFTPARLDVYRCWARHLFESGRRDEGSAVLAQARRELGELAQAADLEMAEAAGGLGVPSQRAGNTLPARRAAQ